MGQNVAGAYQKKGEKIDRPRKRPDSWQGTFGLPFTCELITSEVRRFKLLLNSDRLDDDEKDLYHELISLQDNQKSELGTKLKFSLKKLSELLYQYYGKKVIILIDEYDVPLDKAFQHGTPRCIPG